MKNEIHQMFLLCSAHPVVPTLRMRTMELRMSNVVQFLENETGKDEESIHEYLHEMVHAGEIEIIKSKGGSWIRPGPLALKTNAREVIEALGPPHDTSDNRRKERYDRHVLRMKAKLWAAWKKRDKERRKTNVDSDSSHSTKSG